MATVRIIYSRTGRGLERDANLLREVLESVGHKCEMLALNAFTERRLRLNYYGERISYRLPAVLRKWLTRIQIALPRRLRHPRVDLTIHLEGIFLSFLNRSRINWLIPNQEWFRPARCHYLPYLDEIVCKTREAERIFSELHPRVTFIGFSGYVRDNTTLLPDKDFRCFLHVAGNNQKKGSAALVEAWARHPHWPELTVIINDRKRLPVVPDNVRVLENISDDELLVLRRRAGIVIAPSEVEGFGHVLLEGMAFGSVTVTTDAPPMNELVAPSRGVTIPWARKERCRLGMRYFVSSEAVEAAVAGVMTRPEHELRQMAEQALAWVEQNHRDFVERLLAHVGTVTTIKS